MPDNQMFCRRTSAGLVRIWGRMAVWWRNMPGPASCQNVYPLSGMNFGDMLDIAKWLRMRRKCPGCDLLSMTDRLLHRH